jgi:two-component system cell cycle response regulator
MIRLANVLVISPDSAPAEALAARLSHDGYHTRRCSDPAKASAMAGADHPDLILVGDGCADPVALGCRLKAEPALADIPVVLMADPANGALAIQAAEAGFDDCLHWKDGDTELLARLKPLVRLATMHAELRHRAEVAAEFGVSAAARAEGPKEPKPAVLLVGDDQDGVAGWLGDGTELVTSPNLYDAESLLEHRNFDAALVMARGRPDAWLAFASQVRNNPRLFNLPLLLVQEGGDSVEAYRRGVSRVLARPLDRALLVTALGTLVRRQQLRWSIRQALGQSLVNATRDPVTGTYGRPFLDRYLERRLAVAAAQHRHLSLVVFNIPNVDGVRDHFGEDAALHLSLQLGQWINGLLRAEDLCARLAPNQFCVVLPDTPLIEAEVVMHRIAGVLAHTDFAVREVYQPVKVWVQVGSSDVRAGDTVPALLGRALAKLD